MVDDSLLRKILGHMALCGAVSVSFLCGGCVMQWRSDVEQGLTLAKENKRDFVFKIVGSKDKLHKRILRALEARQWDISSRGEPIVASLHKRRNVDATIEIRSFDGEIKISCTRGYINGYLIYGIPIVVFQDDYIPMNYIENIVKSIEYDCCVPVFD